MSRRYKLEIEFDNAVSPDTELKPGKPVTERFIHEQMKNMFGNGCPPTIKRLVIEQVKDDVRD